ncbi:MAG: MoaD/ThiS family protein [Anaerolineae bacterium]|nr:MoaD/ThiS family protein [Anaerolineae bacterium]
MKITLRFFALARELTGQTQMEMALPEPATLQTARDRLFQIYPALQGASLQFAVNTVYAKSETALHAGDVVACIPPVGGG